MKRRPEFSFTGSQARGAERAPALPPRAEEEEIRWLQASQQGSPDCGSGGSGTPSPQMWSHHEHHNRLYQANACSSPSRAQAIAGYRREMLDLVRGLPESAYELSLRDIVESPCPPLPLPPPWSNTTGRTDAAAQGNDEPADTKKDAAGGTADVEERKKQSIPKKQGRKQRMMRKQRSRSLERSVSLDTGLLIKLFLPLSVGGKKKKVSPKPTAAAKDAKKKEKKKQGKQKDEAQEECWTKSEFSEAGSSSRTSSTGSSSNSSSSSIRNGNGSSNPRAPTRSRSRKRTGCYAFFRANKSKNGVTQD
ncbi:uncharacterized protein LOC133900817 [Phragmites australis]|uniref:uncharacterized protein LOC133900817 n=1 Tax=Phragmites australis TaxID=29695 RepID=UPI002D7806DA|nr:uncharacterized protein LOC133900817 [Phragmites australis]